MRVGALIRSYGLTDFLPAVLRSYAWVDKVVVMNHRFRDVKVAEDKTQEIAGSFSNTLVIKGENFDQHEVLNHGLTWFRDFDWVFIADNDELLRHQDQLRLVDETQGFDAAKCPVIDYTAVNERLPQRDHQPIVLVKPTIRFYDVRCFAGSIKHYDDISMHHFGYAYPDLTWKLEWEKKWEHDGVSKLLGQVRMPCETPQEIIECLKG